MVTRANYTIKQLAERLQVSEATIYGMVRRQELKSFRFGRSIRVSGAEVQRIECGSSDTEESGPSKETQAESSGDSRSGQRIVTRPNGFSVISSAKHPGQR